MGCNCAETLPGPKTLTTVQRGTRRSPRNTPAFVEVPSLPHLDYGPAATDIRRAAAINATYELPFGLGKPLFADEGHAAEALLSGWSLSSISNLFSGFHFSPQLGYNPTGSGDSRNPVRPNRNSSFTGSLYPGGNTAARAAEYFNPNAFSAPAYGTVGNAAAIPSSVLGMGIGMSRCSSPRRRQSGCMCNFAPSSSTC